MLYLLGEDLSGCLLGSHVDENTPVQITRSRALIGESVLPVLISDGLLGPDQKSIMLYQQRSMIYRM